MERLLVCPSDCRERHVHHHVEDSAGIHWIREGPIPESLVTEPTALEKNALRIFSSLEAWSRAPEHHTADTPRRYINMLRQLTEREEFAFTTFQNSKVDEMITLGPIPFYSLCAHHVVPFHGNAWIGYVPLMTLAGLSKFPRAVKYLAKGLWVQEELTIEIADFLEKRLRPRGMAVVLKAEHLCMAMRGVEQPGVITTTSAMRGVFSDHTRTAKAEFLSFVNNGG
jgi:GTP cyclohydrolase I